MNIIEAYQTAIDDEVCIRCLKTQKEKLNIQNIKTTCNMNIIEALKKAEAEKIAVRYVKWPETDYVAFNLSYGIEAILFFKYRNTLEEKHEDYKADTEEILGRWEIYEGERREKYAPEPSATHADLMTLDQKIAAVKAGTLDKIENMTFFEAMQCLKNNVMVKLHDNTYTPVKENGIFGHRFTLGQIESQNWETTDAKKLGIKID